MNVRLDVDPGGYDSAAEALRTANSTVATAYDDLVGDLGGYAGMGGDDKSSEDWVNNYDPTARDTVAAIADLATAWGSLSRAATTSGANHRDANAGSHLRGDSGGTSDPGGTGEPREVSPSTPPSALGADDSGMPEGWDLVVDHLQGWTWPSADVDRLRQAASTWRAAAGMLDYTPDDGASAQPFLDSQRSPEIPQASSRIQEVEGAARDIATTCRDLADSCEDYATQVETTRETIKGLLRDLLIEIAATAAVSALGSLVTFGGAAAAGAAVAVTRAIACARKIIAALVALKGVRAVATAVRSVASCAPSRPRCAGSAACAHAAQAAQGQPATEGQAQQLRLRRERQPAPLCQQPTELRRQPGRRRSGPRRRTATATVARPDHQGDAVPCGRPARTAAPRSGTWATGPGEEYRNLRDHFLNGRITKEEFMRRFQDPDSYESSTGGPTSTTSARSGDGRG